MKLLWESVNFVVGAAHSGFVKTDAHTECERFTYGLRASTGFYKNRAKPAVAALLVSASTVDCEARKP